MAICLLAACSSSTPKDVTRVDELPAIYPDYIGVTIPADIAPLDFAMLSDSVTAIDVEVKGSLTGSLHANGPFADFDIESWKELLRQNRGGELTVSVCAQKEGRWTQYKDFTISISPDSIGEWGVSYRRIAPGYE